MPISDGYTLLGTFICNTCKTEVHNLNVARDYDEPDEPIVYTPYGAFRCQHCHDKATQLFMNKVNNQKQHDKLQEKFNNMASKNPF